MPKRPCSLALTSDDRTILSADKFGDVYALPLIPTTTTTTTVPAAVTSEPPASPKSGSTTPSTTAASTPTPFKAQANELTVHTKRNLRALENQKLSIARRAGALEQLSGRPQFEQTLLLGHVSMLTAICVGTTTTTTEEGAATVREYIITADRDEHIRVSRGMPQAHVIEGFCLGHEDFVSRLCVAPGGRAGVLISGGGDDDLLVWDWVRGALLARAGVLEPVRRVVGAEGAGKVAVTRVFACGAWGGTAVFVVVERYAASHPYTHIPVHFAYQNKADKNIRPRSVPALFRYELLEDNQLQHRETIPLPGNPLDVELVEAAGATAPRLLLAVDPAQGSGGSSLIVLDKEEAGWRESQVENLPAGGDMAIGATELQKILYSTESLRKLSDFD